MIKNYLKRNNFPVFNLKAVLFDMDGVLFDSMKPHSEAWVRAMNESGLPFTVEECYLTEGQPGPDTVNYHYRKKYGKDSTVEERERIYELKAKYFDEKGLPARMPYAYELAAKLQEKGYQLFVVTGSGQPTLLNNIQKEFPELFPEGNIISSFDVERGKPFPDPYLMALDRAGVHPWEAVVIENAPLGVASSHAAQILTLGVNTGPLDSALLKERGADRVFDSMQELYEKWDELNF